MSALLAILCLTCITMKIVDCLHRSTSRFSIPALDLGPWKSQVRNLAVFGEFMLRVYV